MPVAQPASRLAKYFGMARQVLGQGQAFEAQGDLDRVRLCFCCIVCVRAWFSGPACVR